MEIILKEEIQGLGKPWDVVKVKMGYAHNYLLPRGMAVPASPAMKKLLERERSKAIARLAREKEALLALGEKLRSVSVTIAARVQDGERLYGSIQAADIHSKLRDAGYELDKRAVILPEPIKQLGMFSIKVQLHREVETKIKLWVISDESK
jgi:large subunit ribosomal protein L9